MTTRDLLLVSTAIDPNVLRYSLQAVEDRRIARARAGGAFVIDLHEPPKHEMRYAPLRGGKGFSNSIARHFK